MILNIIIVEEFQFPKLPLNVFKLIAFNQDSSNVMSKKFLRK